MEEKNFKEKKKNFHKDKKKDFPNEEKNLFTHKGINSARKDLKYTKTRTFLFAYDLPSKVGAKNWITASIEGIHQHFLKLQEKDRNLYAVILEDFPVYCFFDLEFKKELNPNKNIYQSTLLLLHVFCEIWPLHFDDLASPQLSDFLIFDSSTEKKASLHVHGKNPQIEYKNYICFYLYFSHMTLDRSFSCDV